MRYYAVGVYDTVCHLSVCLSGCIVASI